MEQMNNKELLIDFIEYAKSRHIMPILHSNIEPLVDDYLRQQNLQQCIVSGALELLAQMLNERQELAKDGFESYDALMKNGENERALERVIRLIKERQANDR